ncbi:DUF2313 domain-containing protein [Paucibacter sp. O1-1]|nr:DUF2313 domain-containing protein [Paucibacter sp. O1-1]MDA3826540.1 DUF2313 domain-containing protein [Paucibacter sp. O1-1]
MDKYGQALQHLLPTGYAWPRDPDSVLMRLMGGMAAAFGDLDALTEAATVAWRPQATNTRLEEWEEAVGLPDDCFGPTQTYTSRQARVLAKLRGPIGAYPDSSPASLGGLESVCEQLGYPAEARYNTPFRCGRDRAGQRLGQLDGQLHLLVTASASLLRVGQARVGDRLIDRPADLVQLSCYLQKTVPARFELNVVFL